MEFRLVLPPVPEAVAATRTALAQLLRELPSDVVDTTCLLVTELVTNSLRHAEIGRSDRITLQATVAGPEVRIQVCDPGGDGVPVLRPASLTATWGRGLVLVDSLARRWGVRSNDRMCVWFDLDAQTSPIR